MGTHNAAFELANDITIGTAVDADLETIVDGLPKLLQTDNTTSYTPTLDYHPATKAYVDAGAGSGSAANTAVLANTGLSLTPVPFETEVGNDAQNITWRPDYNTNARAGLGKNCSIWLGGDADNPNAITAGVLNCIIGGYDNTINGALANNMFGTHHSLIDTDATHGHIAGGSTTTISDGDYSFVGGGYTNTISGHRSSILSGKDNNNAAEFGAIITSDTCTISTTTYSSIVACQSCDITSGNRSAIIAGRSCTSSASYAMIAHGRDNDISSNFTMASGYGAKATNPTQEVRASGYWSAAGDQQVSRYIMKRSIAADATPTELRLNSSQDTSTQESGRITFPDDDRSYAFSALVVARSTDGAEHAAYRVEGLATNIAGTESIQSQSTTVLHETDAGWDCDALTGNSWFAIRATSDATLTVHWVASVEIVETT